MIEHCSAAWAGRPQIIYFGLDAAILSLALRAAEAHDGPIGEGGTAMADPQFAWDGLAQYKAEGRFLDGYPDDQRTFFAPRDNVHGLLVAVLGSAQHSIVVNMFGYDDDELNKIIQEKLANDKVYVQMSLDRSQASGVHEKQILANWSNDSFGNSIAIGTSSVHNAISHLKIVIVDGVYTVKGSTNWSLSGEQQQDNELTLGRNAVIAAETRAILDLNHDFMLKQMAGSKLDMTNLTAPASGGAMPPLPSAPE
jgi:phosphatidylserine/phosphatidylglycerophosphate/cardiolipin synthase-like enzyme